MQSVIVSGDPAKRLEAARKKWDTESGAYQKRRLRFVRGGIFVGLAAAAVLAFQAIFWDSVQNRDVVIVAAFLILLELGLLTYAICLPFLKLTLDHDEWIRSRLRAELLRRELYLLFARVGPYLGATAPAQRIEERLSALGDDTVEPVDLLPMQESGTSWRDALEDGAGSGRVFNDSQQRARDYLSERVSKQSMWFSEKKKMHEDKSKQLEIGAGFFLVLGLILAGIHFGNLVTEAVHLFGLEAASAAPRAGTSLGHKVLVFFALCLPAAGSACVAYRSALGSKRQARLYEYYGREMKPLEASLLKLANATPGDAGRDSLQFRRLVLEVEQLLTEELRQWWMNMAIKEPTAHG